jgi:hypothetical protein
VLQLIDRRERGLHDNVSLLDSIRLMKGAWDTVTPATVGNLVYHQKNFPLVTKTLMKMIYLYLSG